MLDGSLLPQSAAVTGNGRLTVPVMAVQLNLSQKEKWDPANRGSIYRALLDMTEQGMLDLQNRALEQAVKNGAEASLDMPAWVIWPESSFPISTFYRDSTGERFPQSGQCQLSERGRGLRPGPPERDMQFYPADGHG